MKCMKTWEIEIDSAPVGSNVHGLDDDRTVAPEKAYLTRRGGKGGNVTFTVTQKDEWTKPAPYGIANYVNAGRSVSCFTTAPEEVLDAWFGSEESIRLSLNQLSIGVTRPNPDVELEDVYKKYGPYWRRFLCLKSGPNVALKNKRVGTKSVLDGDEIWPVYFRLKEKTDFEESALGGLDENQCPSDPGKDSWRFILPPWDPDSDGAGQADSDFGYYRLSSSREGEAPSGVPAREAMRKKMRVAGAKEPEPLALALWRAADDLALRPEMLGGAQIKIGGLPEDFGKIGKGTCPLLCVPTAKTDVEKYRKKVLDLAVADLQPDEGQPSVAVQELAKAISSDLEKVFGTREIKIMDLHEEDKALCLPDFLNHGAEARENSPVFSVTQNLGEDYKKCLLTNGKFLVSPAVSDFAKRWFRPTSVQTFWDPDFWYTLVQFGWTGKEGLVPNEFDAKCRTAADIIEGGLEPSVDEFHKHDWAALCRTTCLPERGAPSGPTRAVLHAALMLPANTKILWGRAALLDEPLSRFDNQSVLG